ncbi:hypothetical protein [Spartinivicinus poritis]|uniref:Uncharacterized protein n=1 Tax=Spartinivicinus poritis TaxID=2994640 RepID=A0ABT5U8J0_9GAMM|nr:hypothetical protein [Spartinivicinus sp. A2-2]MDE1462696.1 hypothetical protein [Spartinivicinus sp. A2-2]
MTTIDINDPSWIKKRKAEWKHVKYSLKNHMLFIEREEHKYLKQYFLTGKDEELNINGDYQKLVEDFDADFYWLHLLVSMWLHPDTSKKRWVSHWEAMTDNYPIPHSINTYEDNRRLFFDSANQGGVYTEYGAFGGLEERMVKFFVLSDHYTDEKILIEKRDVKIIPWKDANTTFIYIFGGCGEYFTKKTKQGIKSNPYDPYQYLIPLMVDCFKYLNKKEFEDEYSINSLKIDMHSLLYGLKLQDEFYSQHIEYGKKIYDILESGIAPNFLLDIWKKVKTEKPIFDK